MKGQLLFLGCGASSGVPMIACSCPVCLSTHPRNKRLRPSVLLTFPHKTLLIDTSPDLRTQALTHHLTHLDGVILTHTHYDHIAGIDELRVFFLKQQRPLPVLASATTFAELKKRYHYLFQERNTDISLTAQLAFEILEKKRGNTTFQDIPLSYFTYEQGGMEVTGFRFGTLAYVSDLSKYSETIFEELNGVKTLIVSALRKEETVMHLSIDQACAFAGRVGAERTILMHLSHHLDYEETSSQLPTGVELAYDGLTVAFE